MQSNLDFMVKKNAKSKAVTVPVKKILIAQQRPGSEQSPYFDLSKKFGLEIDFHPFISLVPISGKEFRKQKIDIQKYSSIIFTSRNAIDHFFRTCDELKIVVSQDAKYFCITEPIALYLQKFINYRKRKVFYGTDGTNNSLFEVVNKHKSNESFLYVCSENQQDNGICNWLKTNNCEFVLGFMYRTESNNVKNVLTQNKYNVICFFTPSGVKSLFDNVPEFKQNGTVIGAFGENTIKAVEEAGLRISIKAPLPKSPSMITALDIYFSNSK